MKIKTLYIDDEEIDLERYSDYFGTYAEDNFEVITCRPCELSEVYENISKESPELILVDLDLSTTDVDGNVIGFNGITLMTELRQKYQNIPLILFTKKSMFENDILSIPKSLLYTIDQIVYKEQISNNETTVLNDLYSLAAGYKELKKSKNLDWKMIIQLLEGSDEDIDEIISSSPPGLLSNESAYSTIEVSKWIRNTLLKYPGILYDSLHAATFLGISEEVFLSPEIQNCFAEAKYSGLFSNYNGKEYWWKSKISEIANENMNDDELMMPLRKAFFENWKRTRDVELERAKCVYRGESPAEWVCYVLKKPMMLKYSLLYHPDSRPDVMDEARVSFEAIRTSNELNDDMIDTLSKDMLKDIRRQGR